MTTNTIVCFFVLVQAETAPDVKVFAIRKLQCLQGYSPAVFELYRGLWGAHFFLFFITGGFCALAMGFCALFHCMVRCGLARLGTVRLSSGWLHFHRSLVPL